MAIDVYLQIDGIKGESHDDRHRDWIEVTGIHWGVHQPRSATANGERVKYFDIELDNVLVGMVKPHLGGDASFLSETVNLKFSKISWTYTQQKIAGGAGGSTMGGWDLATNKIA